jgi:beta-1,4-galactosyltransferase 1
MKLIVPYRDRLENLERFKDHYKGFDILIVEQANNKLFNRGKLFNIGFNECKDDTICFHDVDLLAHDLTNYSKPISGGEHFSGLCEQFNYKVPYQYCFGGVTCFDAESFLKCNGFNNDFWGWGGEDDDLFNRTLLAGVNTKFHSYKYWSLNHAKQPITTQYQTNKMMVLKTADNWQNSGLNNMRYKIVAEHEILGIPTISVDL